MTPLSTHDFTMVTYVEVMNIDYKLVKLLPFGHDVAIIQFVVKATNCSLNLTYPNLELEMMGLAFKVVHID